MARLTPRWYQNEAVDAVMDVLLSANNVNPLAAVVTGGGKALIAAMLAERITQHSPSARTMILAPSMELVKQNTDEAIQYLPPALRSRIGVYCAGLGMKERLAQITIGSPQSIARQVKRFGKIDYVIVDEAHVFDVTAKTAASIVNGLRAVNPHCQFIGLTATPFRMKGLKVVPLTECGLFDAKVYDLTSGRNFNRLLRENFISEIVAPALRFPQIDTEGVKTKGGDFDEAELAARAMAVTLECVRVALDNAEERKHLMWFAVNIEHAKMVATALEQCGESVVVIHGELDKSDRVGGIEAYLRKQHRHIVSVAMLTTGFNAKFVDCIVALRPTRSLVLWRQIVGRGLRPYAGKENVLVLDAGGNFARHGPINAEISNGDSRVGLWECTDALVESAARMGAAENNAPRRELSAVRFLVNSPAHSEPDLRIILGLMPPDMPACHYLNDPEHFSCRQCGRPRQGFLSLSQRRDPVMRGLGDAGYDIHDEESVILRDALCKENCTLAVHDMQVTPEGESFLNFDFHTEFGVYSMRLDFDRTSADNQFFAQSRKFWRAATGLNPPAEAYRAILMRGMLPVPRDLTLTKFEDGKTFITEVRFLRAEKLESFRYDPAY